MHKVFISLKGVKNPEKLYPEKTKQLSSKTRAIAFFMHATGICRLFTEDAVKEFLYRLTTLVWKLGVANTFFKDDVLFRFRFKEKSLVYEVSIYDIMDHMGIELTDEHLDFKSRVDWYISMKNLIKGAKMLTNFNGTFLTDSGEESRIVHYSRLAEKDVQIAQLVVDSAFKTIRKEEFKALSKRVEQRCKELEEYRQNLERKPLLKYNYSAIPRPIKKIFFDHLRDQLVYNVEYFSEILHNGQDTNFGRLLYLAWLWTNGFVEVEELCLGDLKAYTAKVDPRIDFDYCAYDGLDKYGIGFNLFDLYYDYGLDKLSHLLKEKNREERKKS